MTTVREFIASHVRLCLRVPECASPHESYFKYGVTLGSWATTGVPLPANVFVVGYVPRQQSEFTRGYVVLFYKTHRYVFPPHKWMNHRRSLNDHG